jgi:hypothetical protein
MDSFVEKIPNTNSSLIVRLEIVVIEASGFFPPEYSPVPCLYGFLLYLFPSDDEYQTICDIAFDRLQIALMIDDIVLIESPSRVALACILDFNSST